MKSDEPTVRSQEQYGIDADALFALTGYLSRGTILTRHYLDLVRSRGAEYLYTLSTYKTWKRRKPSPIMWRFILIIGDSALLLPLFFWFIKSMLLVVPDSALPTPGTLTDNLIWVLLALAAWVFAVHIVQAQELGRATSRLKSLLSVLGTVMLMLIFVLLLFYLREGIRVLSSLGIAAKFFALAGLSLGTWRILLAECINLPSFRRKAVIIGANSRGSEIAGAFPGVRHRSIDIVGYIGEKDDERETLGDLPILGAADALRFLIQNRLIDMMIVAVDYQNNDELFQVALEGAQQGISLLPGMVAFENISGKIPVEHIGDQWYIALPEQQSLPPFYMCWRKGIDLVFGLCGLIVLVMILPIMACLIYLDSPGPIFFKQERAGYQGRAFQMLKFRSMHPHGGKAEKSTWTSKGDARVTRVGRFMPATHLDELPQMLNIVRGEMSLIGPRPECPEYVAELARQSHFYSYRLSVKPGLTGWSQVKYGYGSSELDELTKLQYDLLYIKHQSYLLDVPILLRTFLEVVLCHGV